MLTEERRLKILEIVEREGKAEVKALSELLGVSGITIRRDLQILEKEGLLRRTRGGALPRGTKLEPPYTVQEKRFLEDKRRIGAEAVKLIQDGDTIILEASTTVLQIAKNLRNKGNITVLTNSITIAHELLFRRGVEIILTGGELNFNTLALLGPLAERCFEELTVDKAFIGISAIDEEGMSTSTLAEASVKKAIIASAREVIGVADHSKFGRRAFAHVAPVESLSRLITDKEAPGEIIEKIKGKGVQVILC